LLKKRVIQMALIIENVESGIVAPEYAVNQLESIIAKWIARHLKSSRLLEIDNSTAGKEFLLVSCGKDCCIPGETL